ncbi:DUF5722 domain-containing protein [Thalassoroseus pseudoceratinae]|uniref:DUF5722 domain-containing protein n=1 Tax=Thalassoroseus pseudoceratinae TaxID=2713176 RepID=UPI00197F2C6B|nr:DUF5722 domain-containing protein [Thalassoroseus pseudoceratinae]
MNTRLRLGLLALTVFPWLLVANGDAMAETAKRKPNVVFILADDLGWSDTTLFGTTTLYKTPNIERLAQRGMTFTRAYSSSPLCSPTRASVLTGLSPARHGITSPNCHLPKVVLKATEVKSGPPSKFSTVPKSVTRLDTNYDTLGEMFQENGYATGHFGKWHLGPEPYSPLQHGFDVDVPHHPGPGPAGSYVAPWKFKDFDHDPDIPDEHLEDRMAKEAVAFMEKHKSEPFFLNYWMFSVHAPFDAKHELIEEYRQQVDPKDPQRSPTYAAMIKSMDDAVGTLLDTLDRLRIADHTIIIFASDNGGNMYNEVDGTTATSNAPLRGGKATMYEGGVRGPAIVVQPGSIKAGSRSDEVIQSSDFYPTLLDLLSIQPKPNQKFDGISIVPALHGKSLNREAIFTYFPHAPGVPDWLPPSVSVHSGDWKLIRIFHGGENEKHRYKLFNLKNDIGEQTNLIDKYPERVKKLDGLIEQHLIDTQAVRPLPNPNFDPSKYDVTHEGKAGLRGGATTPKKPHLKQFGKPVAGWRPGGTCTLSASNSSLIVNSTGKDPYLSHRLPKPISEKSWTLHITMKSDSSGKGQVFWQERKSGPFKAHHSQVFDVRHDGATHKYTVSFTTKSPLLAIRVDPSRGPGKVEIAEIRLVGKDGTVHDCLKLPATPAGSNKRKRKSNGNAPGKSTTTEDKQSDNRRSSRFPVTTSKKGLQVEIPEDAIELGVKHAVYNFNLTSLFATDGSLENLTWERNGRKFTFNRRYVEQQDAKIKRLSDSGALVYLVVLVYRSPNLRENDFLLHPDYDLNAPNRLSAFNTVTPDGREALSAALEFMANRWSGAHTSNGRVVGYIMGNEVNSHWWWSNCGEVTMEEFIDDYADAIKLSHDAVRTVSDWARIYVSLEHHWTIPFQKSHPLKSFPGRDFLERFASVTKERGNPEWHLAYHPYPENLFDPRFWEDKSATPQPDSPRVTFKNLEVLTTFMHQPEMQFAGAPRSIILSEQGFHTPPGLEGQRLQAAAYCYAYRKVAAMDDIDAFILHRHVDHPHEGGLNLGLRSYDPNNPQLRPKKLIYNVFRDADRDNWRASFEFALPIVGLKDWP